jgi:hypothetical protein
VLVLRHLVGLTPGEIANRMGRSESSIRGLHHRGRQVLKRELVELGALRPPERPKSSRPDQASPRRCDRAAWAFSARSGCPRL